MRNTTLLGRLGSMLAMSAGYLCLHIGVFSIAATVLAPFIMTNVQHGPATLMFSEGRFLLYQSNPPEGSPEFRSLQNEPIDVKEGQEFSNGSALFLFPSQMYGQSASQTPTRSFMNCTIGTSKTETNFLILEQPPNDVPRGYIVTYSTVTRQPVAYLGTKGESTSVPPKEEQFEIPDGWLGIHSENSLVGLINRQTIMSSGSHPLYLSKLPVMITRRGLERVSRTLQTTEVIIADRTLIGLMNHQTLTRKYGVFHQETPVGQLPMDVRSATTVYRVVNDQVQQKYTIPEVLQNRDFFAYIEAPDRITYATTQADPPRGASYQSELFSCNAAGNILATQKVEQLRIDFSLRNRLASCVAALGIPTPFMVIPLYWSLDRPGGFAHVSEIVPAFLMLGMLSVVAAWISFRLSRRYHLTAPTSGWLVLIFILGLPGAAGYLAIASRSRHPKIEPAPLTGTEIFGPYVPSPAAYV